MRQADREDWPSESEILADENPAPRNPRWYCHKCFASFAAPDIRDKHASTCTGEFP